MSIIASTLASSVAATQTAVRSVTKEEAKSGVNRADHKSRFADGYESELEKVSAADAVRSLKDNTDEQTREDRREHPLYTDSGKRRPVRSPELDLEA